MISHELKNSLAILNENTGLLSDMILMQKKGIPLKEDRLKLMAEDLERQISRSNDIINNLNYLAHTVDENRSEVSLSKIVDKFILLSGRFLKQHEINFELKNDLSEEIFITSNFFFLNILWILIEKIAGQGSGKTDLELDSETDGKNIYLIFTSDNIDSQYFQALSESKQLTFILEKLNMEIKFSGKEKKLILTINNPGV